MSALVAQSFFESPVITVHLSDYGSATQAAIALAEQFTTDVSRPQSPRFAWDALATEVTIAPGQSDPLDSAGGYYWVAALCVDAGDGKGGLRIEDPRRVLMSAATVSLSVTDGPMVEAIAPAVGEMTMFQGFLRYGLENTGDRPQRWLIIQMRAKPII